MNGKGVGLLTITQGDMVQMFQFTAEAGSKASTFAGALMERGESPQ